MRPAAASVSSSAAFLVRGLDATARPASAARCDACCTRRARDGTWTIARSGVPEVRGLFQVLLSLSLSVLFSLPLRSEASPGPGIATGSGRGARGALDRAAESRALQQLRGRGTVPPAGDVLQ
jgi:hypothetical protein